MVLFVSASSDSGCVTWARLLHLSEPYCWDLWHEANSDIEFVEVETQGIYACAF